MRIRATKHNLARIQNYPNGHHPNSKKKTDSKLNLRPPNALPHGLYSPTHKIHTHFGKPTRTHTAITQKNISNNKIQWQNINTKALEKIKAEITKITEKKTFRQTEKFTLKLQCEPYRPRGSTRTTIFLRMVPNSVR